MIYLAILPRDIAQMIELAIIAVTPCEKPDERDPHAGTIVCSAQVAPTAERQEYG